MASSWHRSKAFRIAAALVGLLLVGLLVAPYLISVDRFRPLITEQAGKRLGREVELDSLRLHFLPSTHLALGNLRIKNPRGFPEGDTLAVEQVDIGLALLPLLRGRAEISSIGLSGVKLNLLENELGANNYESLLKGPKGTGRGKAGEEETGSVSLTSIGAVSLGDVSVSSGSFWRRDRKVHPSWTLSGVNLDARGLDFTGGDWLKNATAEADLSTVEIHSPALKEPLRVTDGSLKAENNAAEGEFSLALARLRAQGTLKISNLARGRPVGLTLSTKELNLADVTAVLSGKKSGGPSGRAGGGLLAQGSVKAGTVALPPVTATNLEGRFRLYGNRLEVNPVSFALYDGRARGNLAVNLASESLSAQANVQIEHVNVAQLVAAANPRGKKGITGTFEASGRLSAPLGANDPLAGLGGDGTFAIRNGTFPGLDIAGTLAEMAKLIQIDLPAGDTRFSFFGGDYHFGNQRVRSNQLRLDAESLEASLRGSVGFDQTLNYSGTGLLKGQGTQKPQEDASPLGAIRGLFGKAVRQAMGFTQLRAPFAVRGTLEDPKFTITGPPTPIR